MKRHHKPVEKVCIVCRKRFVVKWARRNTAKFCSLRCRGKAQSLGLWKEWTASCPITIRKFICQVCHKEFAVKRRKKFDGFHYHKYCSRDCYNKAQKTGVSKRPKMNETKMRRRKAHESCALCNFSRFVEICHLTPPSMGGTFDEENILFLCPNHHRLLDHGLLSKKEQRKLGSNKLLHHYSPYTKKKLYSR